MDAGDVGRQDGEVPLRIVLIDDDDDARELLAMLLAADGHRVGEARDGRDGLARAREEGHEVHFGTMLFHQEKTFGEGPAQWVAHFLRSFCQGVKVCVEILLMAGNAGLVAEGEEVAVVAGTGRGADTALLMSGATSTNLKGMHISRILCKPL